MVNCRRYYFSELSYGLVAVVTLCLNIVWAQPVLPAKPAAAPQASTNLQPVQAGVNSTTANTPTPPPASEPKIVEVNDAAKVALVEGDVTVIAGKNQRRKVKIGDVLVEGDSIVTGKDGELHLDMEDGGYMAIRPNTKMKIVKYQAKGNDLDAGVFGLLQGSFRSVTGWIGKFNREKYIVRTPNATIGIRGTDHEPLVIPAGSADGEAGTYDKVNAGGSVIKTPQGRAEIAPNQAGFVPYGGNSAPRKLQEVPAFFKTTRNERLLEGKHDAVQKLITQRRETRKAEIMKRQGANANINTNAKANVKKTAQADRAANKAAKQEEANKARADAQAARKKAKQEADIQKAEKKAALEEEKKEKLAKEKAEHANKAHALRR